LASLCLAGQATPSRPSITLGPGEAIAPGVRHYRPADLPLDFDEPIVIHALRLDPGRVDLTSDLALGDRQGRATVAEAVRRRGAIAGVNAGFFNLTNGDPNGPLRIDGMLVSHSTLPRGAVAISHRRGRLVLRIDRVTVALSLDLLGPGKRATVPLNGVDTIRTVGGLMAYTPRYGASTGTAPGIEWVLERTAGKGPGSTYTVVKRGEGDSTIPPNGLVISFGGTVLPPPLAGLTAGRTVRVVERWSPASGRHARDWQTADDVVNGAGVLVLDGKPVEAWAGERLAESFFGRHPRTIVGADRAGDVWLVTVDGRQPGYSVGMTLAELRQLAVDLGLVDALNLDGGGSTTMVVGDEVVNRPSDPVGPRSVSDVLLVLPRPGLRPGAAR
jgi:exopolysaccharide biosynthesis protein